MDEDFIRTKFALEELGEMGYTEVWLGRVPNPHWDHGMSTGIVAAPKRNIGWWPAVWEVSERNFGQKSAGNGLKGADNTFRALVERMIPGYYVLVDGSWLPGNNQDLGVGHT